MRLTVRLLLCVLLQAPLRGATSEGAPSLDQGYRLMYTFDFHAAEQEFSRWNREHPDDPLGPVSEAANLLFAELQRLGILEVQFLTENSSFTSRLKPSVDLDLQTRLNAALDQAEAMARRRLAGDADDRDALFTMTLVYGLKADYAALIEKRNAAALGYTRQASEWAHKLLAIAPDYYDAYLAIGTSEYIVGSLVAPVRWMMRAAGYWGNKNKGIQELKLTAERGRFLAPFARILLAVAYLREHDTIKARALLVGLHRDFPSNPLFTRDIERVDSLRN
jgi:tetratricopeptide (TPR) repeat protein